ncbi:hypothetical protein GCM10011415_06350 [Salipiger pallidus]|uniref:Uncharacterized protein n=1 Tax=Salipiger pallidus TaxID=1775170 RepID=A0A8J2ZH55_9RHOB|nr:hypothetical protein [Salipiger pallidus]GGG62734.1 hypothetical protein GCM10011415_06350 [Salipiger pallidus]
MSERIRATAKIRFLTEGMPPSTLSLLVLALDLLELNQHSVYKSIQDLSNMPAAPGTGVKVPDDETLQKMLRCIPAEEREPWLHAMADLVVDDDGARFDRLIELMQVRVAN